jgi:glycosyltransferase involved in cell wall biosynthesis
LETSYFVMLGTIEGRKNHQLILDVWSRLVAERGSDAPTLVIIGQRGWQAEDALARLDRPAEFAEKLLQFDRCGDEELAAWLGGARALLMPSFAEGFGLPVVEALQSGTPVICSNLPVFSEIAGGIPTFLDPLDVAAWKMAVMSFLDDGPERKRQIAAMQSYAAPTWPEHFSIVDAWLRTL